MKKIVIIIIWNLFLIASIYLLYDSIQTHQETKQEKKNLIQEIKETKESIKLTSQGNEVLEVELKGLQETNSEKIREKNIWKKTQEKIQDAL